MTETTTRGQCGGCGREFGSCIACRYIDADGDRCERLVCRRTCAPFCPEHAREVSHLAGAVAQLIGELGMTASDPDLLASVADQWGRCHAKILRAALNHLVEDGQLERRGALYFPVSR